MSNFDHLFESLEAHEALLEFGLLDFRDFFKIDPHGRDTIRIALVKNFGGTSCMKL
jgi:hypothetical protein